MKPKTSPIWKYYVEIGDLKARCKICDKIYSRKGRTTTALKGHLKAMHAEEFEKLDEALKLLSETKEEKNFKNPSTMDVDKMRQKFYDSLSKKVLKENSAQMSTAKYNQLKEEVNAAKSRSKKLQRDYWLLRHYDVIKVGGKEKLIAPTVDQRILYYIPFEQVFNVLYATHESIGHGGRDKMRKKLHRRYKNITFREIQVFLNFCETCLQKRKTVREGTVVKPAFSEFNGRCQDDFIDDQSQTDGDCKYVMQQFLSAPSTSSGAKGEQEEDRGGTLHPVDPLQPTLKHSEGRPQRIGRRRTVSRAAQLRVLTSANPQPEGEDEFIIFGRHVAAQLKKLSTKESIMAQSKIQSILSECRLNDLTRSERNSICTVKSNFSSPELQIYSTDSPYSEEHMNHDDD